MIYPKESDMFNFLEIVSMNSKNQVSLKKGVPEFFYRKNLFLRS